MPQSIYDNGGMVGADLDFADTDRYGLSYNGAILNTSGGQPDFRWTLNQTTNEQAGWTTSLAGTMSYSAGLIPNITDQSAIFDGSANLNIVNSSQINTTNVTKRSISFWFNADSVNGKQAIYEQGGGVNWLNIYIDTGLLYFGVGEGSNPQGHAAVAIGTGLTYHCLMTADFSLASDNLKIYLNGSLVATATSSVGADLASHTGDVNLGAESNARDYLGSNTGWIGYSGKLQDFCYWTEKDLTSTDAQSIYAAGIATAENQKNSGIWSLASVLESITPVISGNTTLNYIAHQSENSSLTSYTFSTNYGVISGTGLAVVIVHNETTGTTPSSPTQVTIDGIAATKAVEANTPGSTHSSIWYAEVSSGTKTVGVEYNLAPLRMSIGSYAIEGYSSTTPIFTGFSESPATPASRTIETSTLGSGVSVISAQTSGDRYEHTWSGLNENYDEQLNGLTGGTSASLLTSSSGIVTATVTPTSATTQTTAMVLAVWL